MLKIGTVPPRTMFGKVTMLLDGNHTPIRKIVNTPPITKEKENKQKDNAPKRKDIKKWKNLDLDCYSWTSYKLKQYAYSHLVVVDLAGYVVYISPGHPAGAHDILFVKKYIAEMFEAIHQEKKTKGRR